MSHVISRENMDSSTFKIEESKFKLNLNKRDNLINFNEGLDLRYNGFIKEYCQREARRVQPYRFRRACYVDQNIGNNTYKKEFLPDFDLRGQWLYISPDYGSAWDMMIYVPIGLPNGYIMHFQKSIEDKNGGFNFVTIKLTLGDYKLPNERIDESTLQKWICEIHGSRRMERQTFEKIEFAIHKPYKIDRSNVEQFKRLNYYNIPRVPDYVIENNGRNSFGDYGGYVMKLEHLKFITPHMIQRFKEQFGEINKREIWLLPNMTDQELRIEESGWIYLKEHRRDVVKYGFENGSWYAKFMAGTRIVIHTEKLEGKNDHSLVLAKALLTLGLL